MCFLLLYDFSAWGLLGADLLQMTAQTKILRLSKESLEECNQILERLFNDLEERGARAIFFSISIEF